MAENGGSRLLEGRVAAPNREFGFPARQNRDD
jgi:hypothetical protein